MKNTSSTTDTAEKTMTLEDLAREIGVSRSLVSIAFTGKGRIAPDTRKKILTSARKLGYEPNPDARRLAGGRCQKTVALVCHDLDAGIGTLKINQLQKALVERGYKVPIFASGYIGGQDPEFQVELMRDLRRQKPRSVICSVNGLEEAALNELRSFQAEGGAVVCYDHPVDFECDKVIFDRALNTYQAACHLLELGHRNIGLFVHGPEEPGFGSRGEGFRRALREWNVMPRAEWTFEGGLYEDGGAAFTERFLKLKERPTALCILNDRAALGFVHEALQRGLRIPEDVSVVGHDNDVAARFCPVPLSTVSHPAEAIVTGVVELLLERLNSPSQPPQTLEVRGEVIQRQSTQPIASSSKS